MNRIAVLGSTGSVGTQTLAVARSLRGHVEVVALAGGYNAELLSEQIAEFHPRLYCSLCPHSVHSGDATFAQMVEIACDETVDTVVVATSGCVGLKAVLAALRHGKRVALASKEVLVIAGQFVMETCRRYEAELIPVDSEHSAILQCLRGEIDGVKRLLLTASGGPFRSRPAESLGLVSPAEALAHPVWPMGRKISIDSATLMNKGLEVIEAHWLFGVPYSSIDVVLHPECVVHSLVEFVDGAVKAQLGAPDMALPIQYALTHPLRVSGPADSLCWDKLLTLSFEPVDTQRYPCLKLARDAGVAGGNCPSVLCGADEAAVHLFLSGIIRFTDICNLVERALDSCTYGTPADIEDVIATYEWARKYVYRFAGLNQPVNT